MTHHFRIIWISFHSLSGFTMDDSISRDHFLFSLMHLDTAFIRNYFNKFETFSFLSILVVTLIIIVYSFILGNLFGHGTFWKFKHLKNKLLLIYNQLLRYSYLLFIGSRRRSFRSDTIKIDTLSRLPDPVLLEVLSYLNGYSIMKLTKLSSRFHKLIHSPFVWTNLYHNTFQKDHWIDFISFLQNSGSSSSGQDQHRSILDSNNTFSIQNYFIYLKKYPSFLLSQSVDTVNVIVRGNVLYLPHYFVEEEHPGGGQIIYHYHTQDATKIFDVSNHSEAALSQMSRYIRWSGQRYCSS